jgi:hypothetical protein
MVNTLWWATSTGTGWLVRSWWPALTKPTINWSVQWATSDIDWGTITLDLSTSNIHRVTIAWNRTIALTNVATNQRFTLRVQQDATWSRTLTWFTTIKRAWGSTPTLTTTASKADLFWFECTWSWTYDGFIIWQNI